MKDPLQTSEAELSLKRVGSFLCTWAVDIVLDEGEHPAPETVDAIAGYARCILKHEHG
jgi:hypothetical protein